MAINEGGKFAGINGVSSDFLKVLMAVKQSAMKDTHVATIAQVSKVDDDITVKPFPLLEGEQEKLITCTFLQDLEISEGDIVLVVFTDRDFTGALKRLKSNQTPSSIGESKETHSEQYGIIIGIIYSESQNVSDD